MKNRKTKNNDILLYNINTSRGLNKKCNIPFTVLLIITNIMLSLYEDELNTQYIYYFFTSFLLFELGLNIYDVVNEINANSKLQRLQNILKKKKIDINFLEEDNIKEKIKYIDKDYIYSDNICITKEVNSVFKIKGK